MGKPNTARIDRVIRETESKLRRVRDGEISALSAGEQTRVALHLGRGAVKVVRGKSPSAADRAVDRILAEAEGRLEAELSAAKSARQALVTEAAAASVEKKTSRWW
ncbi:hypothetical protein CFC35_41945 [Streptomyces sp. FBKL.4005]|uniref:hypothetical protein n=1 Tax=Streptomyces sp. FBKL.4005 TaxID=2015515 RepID=UPI000B971BAD|nr:hypothetical protein [Streptomyces sp. FBKL.4005]OYP09981.1 hypothetical protein CFC35_41945 [Streptomyces sp. FBKL.4005]